MKKRRTPFILLGIIIGMISMLGLNVYANISDQVSAVLASYITFEFDGEAKQLPSGYTVLLYEGRSYVPARFIAEEFGADVEWDIRDQRIKITTPEPEEEEVEVEDPKEEKPSKGDNKVYSDLPITHYDGAIRVRLNTVVLDDDQTRLYLSVHNYEDTPIQLEQTDTTIIVDGKEYSQLDTGKKVVNPYSTAWYQDIKKDETTESIVRMPVIPEDTKELTVKFEIRENTLNDPKTSEIVFDVKL